MSRFAKEIEAERVLCLTATATPSVVKDICAANNGFDIDLEHGVFSTGAFRPKCVGSNRRSETGPCATPVGSRTARRT